MSAMVRLVIPEAPPPAAAASGKQRDLKVDGIRLGVLDNRDRKSTRLNSSHT